MTRPRRGRGPERERAEGRLPREATEPERFRWIVDGHNAIFGIAEWESLQVAGRRREARRALEESLETFGRAAGVQVWVVYDGNALERNPDAVDGPHLRSEYSWPPEDADDRIRFLAGRALRDGERPVVVTSDRRTLAGSLPSGVRVVDVRTFFRGICRQILRRPEKWEPREDLDDVERHFLSQSPYQEDRELAAGDGTDRSSEGDRPASAHPDADIAAEPEEGEER